MRRSAVPERKSVGQAEWGGIGVVSMPGRKTSCLVVGTLFVLASVAAFATSHVRIVRLSYVDGKVQMEKVSGQGLEHAMLNAPIVEGTRILTGSNGLAEVEFEDNRGAASASARSM